MPGNDDCYCDFNQQKENECGLIQQRGVDGAFNTLNAVRGAFLLRSASKVTLNSVRGPFRRGQRGVTGADLGQWTIPILHSKT